MDSQYRLAATVIIWAAFVIMIGIIGGLIAASGFSLDLAGGGIVLVIILGMLVAVTQSTQAVWSGEQKTPSREDERRAAGKAKRQERSRIERLIQDLDDDEIYDLEAMLLARDSDRERR